MSEANKPGTVRIKVPTKAATAEEFEKSLQGTVTKRTSFYMLNDPELQQLSVVYLYLPLVLNPSTQQLSQLDDMLAGLKMDMAGVGSTEEAVKVCSVCSLPITKDDPSFASVGKRYHAACFKCFICKKVLSGDEFVEQDGKFYCPNDHRATFGIKCKSCAAIVRGEFVRGLGGYFHPTCFNCTKCNQSVIGKAYEKEGKLYCQHDYVDLFLPKCEICSKPVVGDSVKIDTKTLHADCFKCHTCQVSLLSQRALSLKGVPYCFDHFHLANKSICGKCTKPVEGAAVNAFGKLFHPNCFSCTTCNVLLTGSFFEKEGSPYCDTHK